MFSSCETKKFRAFQQTQNSIRAHNRMPEPCSLEKNFNLWVGEPRHYGDRREKGTIILLYWIGITAWARALVHRAHFDRFVCDFNYIFGVPHRRPLQCLWNAVWQCESRSKSSSTQFFLPIKCWWNRRNLPTGRWGRTTYCTRSLNDERLAISRRTSLAAWRSCIRHRLDTRGCPCPRKNPQWVRTSFETLVLTCKLLHHSRVSKK